MQLKALKILTTIAILLALGVSMLGSFTRLTDAGLGCPDWPRCYGRFILPKNGSDIEVIQRQYPSSVIESKKAWTEMAHRYAAGTLGFLIIVIFISSYLSHHLSINRKKVLPSILLGLVIFQALLGMWTVTFKLMPIVVIGHLLGGFFIFVCLCLYRLQLSEYQSENLYPWRKWIIAALVLLLLQIILGGMVSANYAGLACIGFPTCNGSWVPNIDFSKGLYIVEPSNNNYQGGVLSYEARVLVQYVHRIFALFVSTYLIMLIILIKNLVKDNFVNFLMTCLVILIILQLAFGIINVVYLLPIWSGVLHNGCAALLLSILTLLLWLSCKKDKNAL